MKFLENKQLLIFFIILFFTIEIVYFPLTNIIVNLFRGLDNSSFINFVDSRAPDSNIFSAALLLIDALFFTILIKYLILKRRNSDSNSHKLLYIFFIFLLSILVIYIFLGLIIAFSMRNMGF